MGIKGLTALISDEAPGAIKEMEIKTYFGRKVAIDASMSLYQFLIAVRQNDGQQLMTESGETTSHLLGFFYRTLRMIDYGIKPMYVFDGTPPDLKKELLKKRFGRREEAREQEEEQKDVADVEKMDQLARRQVRPTRQHNEEVRQLLKLMGIPCVIAPSEAEAQCAELARAGKVFAAGSEDMDTLTFGTPILLKHLTASEQKKLPVHQVDLPKALEGLQMDMRQFIDLCILLGCDYLDPIKGIGPKTALKLIREHKSLENVVEHLKEEGKKSVQIPSIGRSRRRAGSLRLPTCRRVRIWSSSGRHPTSRAWSSSSARTRGFRKTGCERDARNFRSRSARNSRVVSTASSPSSRAHPHQNARPRTTRSRRRRARSEPPPATNFTTTCPCTQSYLTFVLQLHMLSLRFLCG